MFSQIRKFFEYWYLRYLLVTELYMVEPWERIVIHVIFAVVFITLWYFNYAIMLKGISKFVGFAKMADYVDVATLPVNS